MVILSPDINDAELLSMVSAAGLTGNPATSRTLPTINDPKVHLGEKLFFTKGLAVILIRPV